jgi:uncharacterized protein YlxW (UPF0749 family)
VADGWVLEQRQSEGGRPALPLRHSLPLLESLVSDHLDPGYQAAADRRSGRSSSGGSARQTPRRQVLAYLISGLVVLGLVLGIAAASTQDRAAGTDKARTALLHDIDNAQAKQARSAAEQSALAADIRSAQSSLGAGGVVAKVQSLEADSGLTPVRGPGLTVVIDGSTASSGAGAILDRDIQLLVNGLWSSGAEAVAIGGVRLRTTSAIRQAGGAILVDNRPVFWPLTVEAVGNPATLHVNFVNTVGFGRFQTFVSLYGIRFDVSAQASLALPAAAAVNLQYARMPTTTATSSSHTAPSSGPLSGPTR